MADFNSGLFTYGVTDFSEEGAYTAYKPKKYSVYVCIPPKNTEVFNKFEGSSYVVGNDGNDIVVSGTAGEMWCVSYKKASAKYCGLDGTPLLKYIGPNLKNGFLEWTEVETILGSSIVFAQKVPETESGAVTTSNGTSLRYNCPGHNHGGGDFVVCAAGADGKINMEDMWVVNGLIFSRTYERVDQPMLSNRKQESFTTPVPKSLISSNKKTDEGEDKDLGILGAISGVTSGGISKMSMFSGK